MKKRVYLGITVVVLLGIFVYQAPALLSSRWVRDELLQRINSRGMQKVAFANCTIGWHKGIVCEQVEYTDQGRGIQISIPRITGSQGLLAMAVTPHNLGIITIHHPVGTLALAGVALPDNSDQTVDQGAVTGASVKTITKKKLSGNGAPFWGKYFLKLQVEEADVVFGGGSREPVKLISHGTVDATLSSGTVEYTVAVQSGDGQGDATAKGFINLPVRETGLLETMVTETRLQFTNFELQPFSRLLPEKGLLPLFAGRLSSAMLVKTSGLSTLKAKGSGEIHNFTATGGVAGQDNPEFEKISLQLDLTRDVNHGLQIPGLHLVSDVGQLDVTGTYTGKTSRLQAKGQINLPMLFAQFPHLSHINPQTRLDKGDMEITLDLSRQGNLINISTRADLASFAGMQGQRPFRWDKPVAVNFTGTLGGSAGPQVKEARVSASFIELEGSGDLKNFTLHGSSDLGAAFKELGTVFSLGIAGKGQLVLEAKSSQIGEDRYLLTADLHSDDLVLFHGKDVLLPKKEFAVTARLDTPGALPVERGDAMNLSIELSGWPGTIQGKFDSIFTKQGRLQSQFDCQSTLQLARVTDILHTLGSLNPETTVTGTLAVDVVGHSDEKILHTGSLKSTVKNLVMYDRGVIIREPLLELRSALVEPGTKKSKLSGAVKTLAEEADFFTTGDGCCVIDLPKHRLGLRDVQLSSEKFTLSLQKILVSNWQQPEKSLAVALKGVSDLAGLSPTLQQWRVLPEGLSLGGRSTFSLVMTPRKNGQHKGEVKLDIQQPVVSRQGKVLYKDASFNLQTQVQGDLSAGDILFEPFVIDSPALRCKAKAELRKKGKTPFFAVSGNFTPQLEQLLNALLPDGTNTFTAKGAQQEKFTLRLPLSSKKNKPLLHVAGSTTLHADLIRGAGLLLTDVAMPLTINNGVLQTNFFATLLGNRLDLKPQLNFTTTPPLLTLPPQTALFTDVQLERPVVDAVFKRIHPLLGELARPVGKMSMLVEKFSWPVATKGSTQADFTLLLDTSKVSLSAAGIMRDILEIVGFDDDILVLQQSKITCHGMEGRIRCSPLNLLAGNTKLTLSGSAGFDGSLDYLLEIPVTKSLVGTEGFRVLEGTTITVPIKGSSEKAVFDADLLTSTIGNLLTQAAKNTVREQVKKLLPGLLNKIIGQ